MEDLIAAGTAQRLDWHLVVIPGWLPSALGSACDCLGAVQKFTEPEIEVKWYCDSIEEIVIIYVRI